MRSKSTRVVCHSHLSDETRPPLCLTDFGLMEVDSDDAPVLTLTSAALTELATHPKGLTLKSENVKACLEEFFQAFQERQKARGHEAVVTSMALEERTALSLGWAILSELGLLEVSSC